MAVVQISKIQVRRGKKNSDSGIPQLSSAEFAWAVDSQELYIGNGSVAEGAPYVGNTKVLTEHDNILELAASYQFAGSDPAISYSVPRSLQTKLDEYVSVTDFGAIGDGSTDCVAAFETAVTELFRNADPRFKKYLLIPNGEYLFTSDLKIPDSVILRGETQLGAVLNIGANNVQVVTSTGLQFTDFTNTNRPQNIRIENLTVQRTTGQFNLSGVADSVFNGVRFLGNYELGDTVSSLAAEPAAVYWYSIDSGRKVTNLIFNDCIFESNSVSIKSSQTLKFDTYVYFNNCKFFVNHTSIYITGVEEQGNRWQIYDCEFEEIYSQAFRSTFGQGTLINRCEFKNVGNASNQATTPTDVMVYFGEPIGNIVHSCTSNRQQNAGITTSELTAAFTEVQNGSVASFVDKNYAPVRVSDGQQPLAVFSALNKYTVINYSLKLGNHARYGTLTLTVGDDLAGIDNITSVSLTDNYSYSPTHITSLGGALMTNFEFSATLKGNTGDSGMETVVLSYKNPSASGLPGSISFDVTYGV